MFTYHMALQMLLALAGICAAKGGIGSVGRGASAARSSVSSGSFHPSSSSSGGISSGGGFAASGARPAGYSSSSSGRASFSSAATGAAVGGTAGFAAGMATHSMISSHVPIVVGHRSYYWSNSYTPSRKAHMEKCSLNLTDDPIFSELEFDNSTDNSTYPEAVVWECLGRCDYQNMACIDNDKSILIIVVVVIVSVLGLTVFFVLFGRWKKQCAQRCNEAQRRREYEVSGGGGGPTDGMAPLPRTPIPHSPIRRPYSAKV